MMNAAHKGGQYSGKTLILQFQRSQSMTTTTAQKGAAATRSKNTHGEPITKLQKRIGSTLYIVTAYTDPNATETMEDKFLRLIESEANKSA
jgi:hypothetical protein